MDHPSSRRRHSNNNKHGSHRPNPSTVTAATGSSEDADQCDPRVWEMFNSSFSQVQSVLDRNRTLIQQVNDNHQSKIPDNMVKNVALIQEINHNITKVASLYSDLSTNFSSACHPNRPPKGGGGSPDA